MAKSDYQFRLVCLSVPIGRSSMKFDIRVFFENLSRNFEVCQPVVLVQ